MLYAIPELDAERLKRVQNVEKATGLKLLALNAVDVAPAKIEDEEVVSLLDPNENSIVHLSNDELKLFKDAVSPLIEKSRSSLGSYLFGLLE